MRNKHKSKYNKSRNRFSDAGMIEVKEKSIPFLMKEIVIAPQKKEPGVKNVDNECCASKIQYYGKAAALGISPGYFMGFHF